jgi:SOS response associated peptidase (SRAP)
VSRLCPAKLQRAAARREVRPLLSHATFISRSTNRSRLTGKKSAKLSALAKTEHCYLPADEYRAALQHRADHHDRGGGAASGRSRSPIDALGLDPAMLEKEVPSTPNARAETIVSKPIFPAAFMRGRCLIRASGYYE